MKLTRTQIKKLLYEGFEENLQGEIRFVTAALENLLGQLLKQLQKLDLSIDYLTASFTGEDPLNIGVRQAIYGRTAGVRGKKSKQAEQLQKEEIRRLVKESLEDREYGSPEEDETNWKPIPPEELHDALAASIWDLYKSVNGTRPRHIDLKSMSVPELETMWHSLSAELKDTNDRRDVVDPEEDYVEAEAEEEIVTEPEEGEEFPQRQGMGRRPLVGPARDVRRGRYISEDISGEYLREIITEEYRKVLAENITNIKFTEDELGIICAALNGYDKNFLDSSAFTKLYNYYQGEIPSDIDSQSAGEWILDQLDPEMIDGCAEAGEMHFLQEGKQKRRS